jgi:methyl-accepting chemotaxis protein
LSPASAEFREVDSKIARAAELVGSMASASKEQALGIDQINTAVARMDKATQSFASVAEKLAESAGAFRIDADGPQENRTAPRGRSTPAAPLAAIEHDITDF